MTLDEMMRLAPVIPVLTIEDAAHAVPLAQALVAGGLRVLEVTLRTPEAIEAIRQMSQVEGAIVGAGTVLTSSDLDLVAAAGASFAVSPGLMEGAQADGPVPLLPGVATATELMRGLAHGFTAFKFFPAVPAGGAAALKAFAPVFPQARFCPTGGISPENAGQFLALPNVACVGGSWLAPLDAVRAGDWKRVTQLARACQLLRAKPG